MGLTGRRLPLLIPMVCVFWVGFTAAAQACTPIPVTTTPAVLVAWLAWLALTACLQAYPFAREPSNTWWMWGVPFGCLGFAVPMFLGFIFPLVGIILFIAFPMHLGIEFCRALFGRLEAPQERTARLVYYGLPLGLIIVIGTGIKWSIYSSHGVRALMWNYLEYDPARNFFIIAVLIGLAVLVPRAVRWNVPPVTVDRGPDPEP